jgi:poly[(R)-3-hydroxyalkanoate] polymerase subunit PhaC
VLVAGKLDLVDDKGIDLANVRQPVLNIAGSSDVLAPEGAVRAVGGLLPNAAEVNLETCPGGHLGVLTGRSAQATTWQLLDEFLGRHEPLAAEGQAAATDAAVPVQAPTVA